MGLDRPPLAPDLARIQDTPAISSDERAHPRSLWCRGPWAQIKLTEASPAERTMGRLRRTKRLLVGLSMRLASPSA
jgi:hypothetical protein